MKKKGFSHVETIISFLIFITVIGFTFYFFIPSEPITQNNEFVSQILNEIINLAEEKIIIYGIVLDESLNENIEGKAKISLTNLEADYKIRAESYYRDVINARIKDESVIIDLDEEIFEDKGFIRLYIGKELPESLNEPSGDLIELENLYKIASFENSNIILEKKLIELGEEYSEDYDKLKDKLGVPSRNDYKFKLNFDNGEGFETSMNITDEVNVYSSRERIEIIRENGGIDFGQIIVETW